MPNVKWATFSMTGSVWRRTRIRRFIGRSVPQSMVIVTANSISHISIKKGLGRLLIWKRQITGIRKLRSRTMILPSKNART